MFAGLKRARKVVTRLAILFSVLFVAACETTGGSGRTINTARPVPVALLVPGGSAQAGDAILAKSLEDAARLAISDLGSVKIDLRVYNTAGQPDQAAKVARQAVNDGAKIILGPVYAEAANAVGVAVRGRNVNVLAFSNNTAIAGGNVFVLGSTFDNTARRLAGYANAQGRGRILVIYGQGSVSEETGRDAIVRAVQTVGGSIAGTAPFERSQNGVINAVPGIAEQVASSGAQAVFFTSGTEGALPLMTQLLPENGVKLPDVQFIGLTRWDVPQATLMLPGVQGGWFALPDPAMTAQFHTRFGAAFGGPPHQIAGLAYDGIAAIGALVKAGKSDALTTSALTTPSGFVGVNGIFRLLPNGTNERGLAIAQISNNQVNVIDPAPKSFGSTGF